MSFHVCRLLMGMSFVLPVFFQRVPKILQLFVFVANSSMPSIRGYYGLLTVLWFLVSSINCVSPVSEWDFSYYDQNLNGRCDEVLTIPCYSSSYGRAGRLIFHPYPTADCNITIKVAVTPTCSLSKQDFAIYVNFEAVNMEPEDSLQLYEWFYSPASSHHVWRRTKRLLGSERPQGYLTQTNPSYAQFLTKYSGLPKLLLQFKQKSHFVKAALSSKARIAFSYTILTKTEQDDSTHCSALHGYLLKDLICDRRRVNCPSQYNYKLGYSSAQSLDQVQSIPYFCEPPAPTKKTESTRKHKELEQEQLPRSFSDVLQIILAGGFLLSFGFIFFHGFTDRLERLVPLRARTNNLLDAKGTAITATSVVRLNHNRIRTTGWFLSVGQRNKNAALLASENIALGARVIKILDSKAVKIDMNAYDDGPGGSYNNFVTCNPKDLIVISRDGHQLSDSQGRLLQAGSQVAVSVLGDDLPGCQNSRLNLGRILYFTMEEQVCVRMLSKGLAVKLLNPEQLLETSFPECANGAIVQVGDHVFVSAPPRILAMQQTEKHGGWHKSMKWMSNRNLMVQEICMHTQTLRVAFRGRNLWINPASVKGSYFEDRSAAGGPRLAHPPSSVMPESSPNCIHDCPIIPPNEVTMMAEISRGAFGIVYRAEWGEVSGVAKAIERSFEPGQLSVILEEVAIQRNLNHPNIVKVLGVSLEHNRVLILMEHINGRNLWQMILSPAIAASTMSVALQIAEAVRYLHDDQQVLHCDIKPENILITFQLRSLFSSAFSINAYLTDFGASRRVESEDSRYLRNISSGYQVQHNIGTPKYLPLERLNGSQRHSDKTTDIYSLGATLTELFSQNLLYGRDPLNYTNDRLLILKSPGEEPHALTDVPSKQLRKVLQMAMHFYPKKRPTARALLTALTSLAAPNG